MAMKDKFIKSAKIDAEVSVTYANQEVIGKIASIDRDCVEIENKNGNKKFISLDAIVAFEFIEESAAPSQSHASGSTTVSRATSPSVSKPLVVTVHKAEKAQPALAARNMTDPLHAEEDSFFETLSIPNVTSYNDLAQSNVRYKVQSLHAVIDSLNEAVKNHESSVNDYGIHSNIVKLQRIIQEDPANRVAAANVLGAVYYQFDSNIKADSAYRDGDDYISGFAVAHTLGDPARMEYYARCHFEDYNSAAHSYVFKWMSCRMVDIKDYSCLLNLPVLELGAGRLRAYCASARLVLSRNEIPAPAGNSKEVLQEMLDLIQKRLMNGVKETVVPRSTTVTPIKTPTPAKNESHYKAAMRAYEDLDFANAERLYIEAIRHGERPEQAVASLTNIAFRQHDYAKCERYLYQYRKYMTEEKFKNILKQVRINNNSNKGTKAVSPRSTAATNYFVLGERAANEEKDLQKAIELYKQAIQHKERLTGAVPNLVSIYVRLGMFDDALALMAEQEEELIKREKYDRTKFLNLKLQVYDAAKDPKYQQEVLDLFLEMRNTAGGVKLIELYAKEGQLLTAMQDYADATTVLKTGIKKLDSRVNLYSHERFLQVKISMLIGLINAYRGAGNMQVARERAEELLRLQPDSEFAKAFIQGTFTDITDITDYTEGTAGGADVSEYILQMIEDINLGIEIRNQSMVEDGVFTGTVEDAKKIVDGIQFRQMNASVNKNTISNYHFTIAKLIKQILDRRTQDNDYGTDDQEAQESKSAVFNEEDYRTNVAYGTYYYGYYKLKNSSNRDMARYCLYEAMSTFRGATNTNFCCAASGILYINSYIDEQGVDTDNEISALKKLRKHGMINNTEYHPMLFQQLVRPIPSGAVRDYVIGIMDMLTASPQVMSVVLKGLYGNPMVGDIRKVLYSLCGETSSTLQTDDSGSFENFEKLWLCASNMCKTKRREMLHQLDNEVEAAFQIGRLKEAIDRFAAGSYDVYLNQTDREYVADLQSIFSNLLRYSEESEFDYKSRVLSGAEEARSRLEDRIREVPTYLAYEKIRTRVEGLQRQILHESNQLYGNSEPRLAVEAISCAVDKAQMIASIVIAITNENNVQSADNVSIFYEGDGIRILEDQRLSARIYPGDGRARQELVDAQIASEILDRKEFYLNVTIQYRYKKDLSSWIDEEKKETVQVRFGDVQFEPIINKFEPYKNGSEVKKDEMFYGRDRDIEEIIDQISDRSGAVLHGRSLALYGQTRTGKSSLLYHLKNKLRERDAEANIIIDIGSLGEMELKGDDIRGFLYTVLYKMDREIRMGHPQMRQLMEENGIAIDPQYVFDHPEQGLPYFNHVFWDVNDLIEQSGRNYSIIVLVDEFTYVYDWIRKGIMTDNFMKFWKAFVQNNGVFAIIIGQDHMMRFVNEPDFVNDFGSTHLRKVTYLDKESAQRLMDEPIRLENGESRYQQDALDRLYELTAGSAYLIMNLCAGLVDYLNAKQSTYITRAHVDDYLKKALVDMEERFFEPQYDDKSNVDKNAGNEENKRILRRIASLSGDNGWTMLDDVVRTTEDQDRINALKERDVLEVQGDRRRCRIKVALYTEWMLTVYGREWHE